MASEKKYGAGGRKEFVRTRVPLAELISGAVILLLLLVIGFAIYHKGKVFDPNRYNVRTEALKSTAAAVEGKAGTVPSENKMVAGERAKAAGGENSIAPTGGEGRGEGEDNMESPASPKSTFKNEPLEIVLPGIKPMSDTEFYNSDNLYEKIDGRAPAYQSFNVQQLRCRTFVLTASSGSFVDVFEYRFDNPLDAFGMFAQERDPKGSPLDGVADGYSSAMGFFFRQGAVYVQIIASDVKPETIAAAKSIAENRAKELPADDSGLAGRRKLPSDGLIAGSVEFVRENAQGQSALKEVFEAKYKFDGDELPFFVMVATTDDAVKAWQSFQEFCGKFGVSENLPDVNGAKLFRAQLFGKWKVVYQRDGEVGGVFDVADAAKAQAFLEKYLRGEMK